MSFEELRELILDWAFSKKLVYKKNARRQYGKFVEEVGEFEEAWLRFEAEPTPENKTAMMMEFGDVLVTLIILAAQLYIKPLQCLEMAYFKIKDRKGKTIDGTFIKEEDL